MGKIVAIGGGEIGRPGFDIETEVIDRETIRLTGKNNPNLLFIPTASNDNLNYVDTVKKYFGDKLGCNVDVLFLVDKDISFEEISNKILSSDIVYVGGGNTRDMMELWIKLKVDVVLKEAFDNGIVLSGLSAGGICWFDKGCSDSDDYSLDSDPEKFVSVLGFGIAAGTFCPHFDVEIERENGLKKILLEERGFALAFDNCTAIEIIDDKFRIIKSSDGANVYRVYFKDGIYCKEVIDNNDFLDLKLLLL